MGNAGPDNLVVMGGTEIVMPIMSISHSSQGIGFEAGEILIVPYDYHVVSSSAAYEVRWWMLASSGNKVTVSIPGSYSGIGPCGIYRRSGEFLWLKKMGAWTFFPMTVNNKDEVLLISTLRLPATDAELYGLSVTIASSREVLFSRQIRCDDDRLSYKIEKKLAEDGVEHLTIKVLQNNGQWEVAHEISPVP